MSPAFPARRRAEQFDAMVEGTSTTQVDAAAGDLLEIVATLRSVPVVQPRAEFVAALRGRLMTAAATELAGARTTTDVVRPQRTGRDRRLATALGGFALVGATASMAVAAQSALPGDQLYPMKRAMENAHTHLSVGNDAKGATLLANASGRLAEVDELTHGGHAGDADATVITDTLTAFTDQATEASDLLLDAYAEDGDESAINDLAAFTDTSLDTLGDLAPDLPAQAHQALVSATETIGQIQQAALEACPTCAAPALAAAVAPVTDPITHIVKHPPVVPPTVSIPSSHSSDPAPTTAPDPEPTDPPLTTAGPTGEPTPTVTTTPPAPAGPTILPTGPTSQGTQGPSSGPSQSGHGPLHDITTGITIGNPAHPATSVSDAAQEVADALGTALTGLGLGGGGKAGGGKSTGGKSSGGKAGTSGRATSGDDGSNLLAD